MRSLLVAALIFSSAVARADEGSVARAGDDGVVRVRLIPETSAVVRSHPVPWPPRGHSVAWKTGAIITFTSLGVMAMGAAMLFSDWPSDWHHLHKSDALGVSGLVIGCVGAGGLVLGGPALWTYGIGEGDGRDVVTK